MDFPDEIVKPILIEPGVKYFLNQTLKQAHIFKMKYYNVVFNIGLLLLFLCILGIILVFKYKGKLSPIELQSKNIEKQQYILSKIKNLQQAKRMAHQELITGLPNWGNEYDVIHK